MPATSDLYVTRYKGIFTSPPRKVPSLFTPDGPIAGNGDLGIVYGGPPEKQCFYFSKTISGKLNWVMLMGYMPARRVEHLCKWIEGCWILCWTKHRLWYYLCKIQERGLTWNLKSWVPATDNLVVIELSCEGAPCTVNLDFWVKEGNESRVESGIKDGIYWFTRHFDAPDLVWPTHLTAAMKIFGATILLLYWNHPKVSGYWSASVPITTRGLFWNSDR